MNLIKPKKLNIGDKVATVSLSSGCAGDADSIWRYHYGVSRLQNEFGLEVVAMPNSLKGSEFIYNNPKARAEDFMQAFSDPTIKGIFSNIGGDESIRMLPYIDFDIIKSNPKVFIGFSDTTTPHLMCLYAGLSSFYGTSVICEFAENVAMHENTKRAIDKALFSTDIIGKIAPACEYTSDYPNWSDPDYSKTNNRDFQPNTGFELLQGSGKVQGQLIGGCIEVLEMCKETEIFPTPPMWRDSIMFIETSEEKPDPTYFKYWMRNYGSIGVLERIKGIVVGKPHSNMYYDEYKNVLLQVMREFDLSDLPILYNLPFGHTCPSCVLPYGAMAEIDCDDMAFSILESGAI